MSSQPMMVVRVYLSPDKNRRDVLFRRLREWGQVSGATLFHGVRGFGPEHRESSEPLVIEFFETEERAKEVMDWLGDAVEPGHIVYWRANVWGAS